MIDFSYTHLLVGIIVLLIALIILWKQEKDLSYLFCFSVFWIYLIKVAGVIIFPFPIFEDYSYLNLKPNINLVPFDFGSCEMMNICLRNIYENILVTVPFGFGISFIARLKPRDFIWLGFLVGLAFEGIQLIISLIASPFRVIDINDVILNTFGVFIGYGFYRIFGWLYLLATQKFEIRHKYLFAYIYSIVNNA